MMRALLINSLWLSVATTLLAVAGGALTALHLSLTSERQYRWGFWLLVIAAALPSFLVTDCWMRLGGSGRPLAFLFGGNVMSRGGALWVMVLLHWPLASLVLSHLWRGIDLRLLEVDPHIGGWCGFRSLLWPQIRGRVAVAALMIFGLSLNQFTVPALLQVKTLPAALWIDFNTTFDAFAAFLKCAPALVLLGLAVSIVKAPAGQNRVSAAVAHGVLARLFGRSGVRRACASFWILAGLSAGLPLGSALASSATWIELPKAAASSGGMAWMGVLTASLAATVVCALGLVLARWRSGWVLWIGFWVPGVAVAVALIVLLNRPALRGIYPSVAVVILGLVIRFLGIGWMGAWAAMRSVPPGVLEDARLAGAGWIRQLSSIVAPLHHQQLTAAWYTVYVLSLWDVEILSLITPPGSRTLSLEIFNLLHYGHTSQVLSLSVLLLLTASLPAAVGLALHTVLSRRRSRVLVPVLLFGATVGCGRSGGASERAISSTVFSSVRVLGTRGVGIGEFNKPRSVAADKLGRIYVVDMTGRVQRFGVSGGFETLWQMPQTDLGKPKGMTVESGGSVVVLEPHYSRVNQFTPEGVLVGQWGRAGQSAGEFAQPRAVALNSLGEVYVAEFGGAERVQRFSRGGTNWIGSWGGHGSGPSQFNRPEGIAVDSQDRVLVADSCNHRVQVFDRAGTFLREFGRPGKAAGELSYPYDVCVDAQGRIFVCEFGNSRVQVFSEEGRSLEILGKPGDQAGELNNPWSVALDPWGNLFVADSGNHRIVRFERRGK